MAVKCLKEKISKYKKWVHAQSLCGMAEMNWRPCASMVIRLEMLMLFRCDWSIVVISFSKTKAYIIKIEKEKYDILSEKFLISITTV